ncbi:MAG: hypothetical protein RL662_2355 [Bacteroidota bacterium]|jgi:predicted nucleic acid-binding Zn ribbon protein
MSDNKRCPLCGKSVVADNPLCTECQDHVDNQYTTDLLDHKDQAVAQEKTIDEEDVVSSIHVENKTTNTKRKGMSAGVIFILIGCVLMVAVGVVSSLKMLENQDSAENEDTYWMQCVQENTQIGYAKYIVAFENGKYMDEAVKKIELLKKKDTEDWETLKKTADINDYYAYLSNNPATLHIDEIRHLMDSLSWQNTLKDNTEDGYKAYIENVLLGNISGKHIEDAKEKHQYLSEIKPIEGAALDSLKVKVVSIFGTMSENKPNNLLKLFLPKAMYQGKEMISTDIVALIMAQLKEIDIKEIAYTLNNQSIIAKSDNRGSRFINLQVDVHITYNTIIKTGKKQTNKQENVVENIFLELNREYCIKQLERNREL